MSSTEHKDEDIGGTVDEGVSTLYAALGLQSPEARENVLRQVRSTLTTGGFSEDEAWVDSYRYNIVRIGVLQRHARYVKMLTGALEGALRADGYDGIVMRVTTYRKKPGRAS